jgi:hypothetical protein
MDRNNEILHFAKKTDLLQIIKGIYDSLLDISIEIGRSQEKLAELRTEIRSLRKIIVKDLTLREDCAVAVNMDSVKMTVEQWNEYLQTGGRSASNSGS